MPACVSRGVPRRFAERVEVERVVSNALEMRLRRPDICAFRDGIVLRTSRSTSAPCGRIDAKVVQRMLILSIGTDRFERAVL